MKQLKFVISSPIPTGMATLNFQDTLTIDPYSQIAMDKFFMTIPSSLTNANTNIEIPTQVISLNNNVNQLFTDSTAVFTEGIYPTIQDVITELNQAFNSVLDTQSFIVGQEGFTQYLSDLGFRWDSYIDASSNIQIGFYRVDEVYLASLAPTIDNMIIVDNNFKPSFAVGDYQLLSNDASPILNGGLRVSMNFFRGDSLPLQFGFRNKKFIDLADPDLFLGQAYGIQADSDNNWYFFNQDQIQAFTDPMFEYSLIEFFVSGGDLRILITETDENYVPIEDSTPEESTAGYFDTFRFNEIYDFFILGQYDGTSTKPNWINVEYTPIPTSTDQLGSYINPKPSLRYLPNTLGQTLQSVVRWDWTQAPILRQGLGLSQTVYYSPQASTYYYTSTNAQNFNQIYDYALETSSLPLQTFQSEINTNGQRRNVISYFTPVPVSTTTTTNLIFDSRHLDFIDLQNEFAINLNSLTFRVFDVANNDNVIADYISFNLFVKSPKENLVKLIN